MIWRAAFYSIAWFAVLGLTSVCTAFSSSDSGGNHGFEVFDYGEGYDYYLEDTTPEAIEEEESVAEVEHKTQPTEEEVLMDKEEKVSPVEGEGSEKSTLRKFIKNPSRSQLRQVAVKAKRACFGSKKLQSLFL